MSQRINRCNAILMIAVEYPPCRSAGTQRTLKFSEYLPQHGWQPLVLTAAELAYSELEESSLQNHQVVVRRAFALDSLRHLRIAGKYLGFSAIPDRYVSWYLPAVLKGLWLIWRHKPRAIYSTFPYYTAHWVGLTLSRITGLPWIADYRDPAHHHYMFDNAAADSVLKRQYSNRLARWIDQRTAEKASRLIFTTQKALDCYDSAYPDLNLASERGRVIPNGFNDDQFADLERGTVEADEFVLLHSGAVSMGRDPHSLIQALAELRKENPQDESIQRIRLHFRGNVDAGKFAGLLASLEMEDVVRFFPSVSYAESIREMMNATALLLLQGEVFKFQIPGKAYEYIASNKPILTLAGDNSATSELMESVDASLVASLKDVAAIKQALVSLVGIKKVERDVLSYGRKHRTRQLVETIEQVISGIEKC